MDRERLQRRRIGRIQHADLPYEAVEMNVILRRHVEQAGINGLCRRQQPRRFDRLRLHHWLSLGCQLRRRFTRRQIGRKCATAKRPTATA